MLDIYQKLWKKKNIHRTNLSDFDYSHLDHENMVPRQILWHLLHDTTNVPKCQNCGGKVKWFSKSYRLFCKLECVSPGTLDKRKQSFLERYGVENPQQSKEIRDKTKNTNLEKYGVTHPLKSKDIQEKIRQTNIERYGVENPQQSDEIRAKTKQTNLERYGVEFLLQSDEIHQKSKETMLERYGVENPTQSKEIQMKKRKNNLEKYGVEYYTQLQMSDSTRQILFDENQFTEFMKNKTANQAARKLNVDLSTIFSYIQKYQITDYVQKTSYLENEMKQLLEDNGFSFIQNTRKIIGPYELDFYLPDHQIAIEMNGEYWHSNEVILETRGMSAEEYHQMKTDLCRQQDIELIHINEDSWNNQLPNQLLSLKNLG